MDLTISMKLFAALFAIMNPLVNLPIFLALTSDQTAAERRATATTTIIAVAVGSVVCSVLGAPLLAAFGIDVNHFRLAGGLIVLLIALSMLNGTENATHSGTQAEKATFSHAAHVAIYPMATPILLGPGSISTMIVFFQRAKDAGELPAYGLGLVGYLVFFAVCLITAPWLSQFLSTTVLSVTKRLMGMILAAIAMEMLSTALGAIFPAWLG
ncbi:multiple antibiotic resistance protein [Pseudoxanthobacter soli DSM 19599]|uniref:UPF0056 membrane protein n=1 Tax=Pseudoxanthobacter soli DSM 19599 TaxID=1123029 RepID=A0A1M7ZHP7_9HYPH|nr:NAAT family transporter [Pseudoxanthobacter soli]SHO64397.1 multiple antibiotic resistance protein [Pseudoxanthobacter soli DSM 19599]